MTKKMFKFSGSLIRAGNNIKTIKGDLKTEYVTAIMYLAPADLSGMGNVCSMAVIAGCKKGCLNLSGMGYYSNVQKARINKTKRFFENKNQFMLDLHKDIEKFEAKCVREKRLPAIRLNGTSDIMFENIPVKGFDNIMLAFPNVQFYDYTKIVKRTYKTMPNNYHLTLSYSEANKGYAESVVKAHNKTGISVAIVVRTKDIAHKLIKSLWLKECSPFWGSETVSGDETDLRFLDSPSSIVVLYAKGKGRTDTSGFVVDAHTWGDRAHHAKQSELVN